MFRTVIAALQGLSAGSSSEDAAATATVVRRLYVLESLATVKSPLILVELVSSANTSVAAAAEATLVSLFHALLDAVRGDASKVVEAHAAEIVCSVLDELDVLPSPLLEPLLARLLLRSAAPRAFGLVAEILRRRAEKLAEPVSSYLKTTLLSGHTGGESAAAAASASASATASLRVRDRPAALAITLELPAVFPAGAQSASISSFARAPPHLTRPPRPRVTSSRAPRRSPRRHHPRADD